MKRTVGFNDVSAAYRVSQHLYHVIQDSEKLIFSEFDEAAFKVAVALEGLTREDYRYISDNPISPAHTGIAFRPFGRPRFTLDFTIEAPENHYHPLSLNVLPDMVVVSVDGYDEFPLVIDVRLSRLIRILQRARHCESPDQNQCFTSISGDLESACMQIRDRNSFRNAATVLCNLVLRGSSQSQEIQLILHDPSLNINRSIFE